jgi:hypothetical protein
MRIGRIILIGWNALLVCFCLYLLFGGIDQGISLTYCRQENINVTRQRDTLRSLFLDLVKDVKRSAVETLAAAKYPNDYFIKPSHDDEPLMIVINTVGLQFRGDELVGIDAND